MINRRRNRFLFFFFSEVSLLSLAIRAVICPRENADKAARSSSPWLLITADALKNHERLKRSVLPHQKRPHYVHFNDGLACVFHTLALMAGPYSGTKKIPVAAERSVIGKRNPKTKFFE